MQNMTDECRICKYFFETDYGEWECLANECVFEEEENVVDEETIVCEMKNESKGTIPNDSRGERSIM